MYSKTNSFTSVTFTHLCEELVEYPHEVTKGQIIVCNHALYLVELSQVSCIQSFIPKHPVDGEILDRRELFLLTELIEHAGTDGSGVSAKDVLLSLLKLPVVLIAMYTCMSWGREGEANNTQLMLYTCKYMVLVSRPLGEGGNKTQVLIATYTCTWHMCVMEEDNTQLHLYIHVRCGMGEEG